MIDTLEELQEMTRKSSKIAHDDVIDMVSIYLSLFKCLFISLFLSVFFCISISSLLVYLRLIVCIQLNFGVPFLFIPHCFRLPGTCSGRGPRQAGRGTARGRRRGFRQVSRLRGVREGFPRGED